MQLFTLGANGLTLSKLNKLLWTIAESVTVAFTVGTGEDNLISLTIPGGTLNADGDTAWFYANGSLGANANNKIIKFKLNGTSLGSAVYNAAGNGLGWEINFRLTRTGPTSCLLQGTVTVGTNSAGTYSTGFFTPTWANDVTILITGEGTADQDVVQRSASIVGIPGV